jgi:hypothetical protein
VGDEIVYGQFSSDGVSRGATVALGRGVSQPPLAYHTLSSDPSSSAHPFERGFHTCHCPNLPVMWESPVIASVSGQ